MAASFEGVDFYDIESLLSEERRIPQDERTKSMLRPITEQQAGYVRFQGAAVGERAERRFSVI